MRAIFVQIKCEMGQSYQVAQEAADQIAELSELYSTSGHYDLLGKFYLPRAVGFTGESPVPAHPGRHARQRG